MYISLWRPLRFPWDPTGIPRGLPGILDFGPKNDRSEPQKNKFWIGAVVFFMMRCCFTFWRVLTLQHKFIWAYKTDPLMESTPR